MQKYTLKNDKGNIILQYKMRSDQPEILEEVKLWEQYEEEWQDRMLSEIKRERKRAQRKRRTPQRTTQNDSNARI